MSKAIIILTLVLFSTQVLCDGIDCTTLNQQALCQTNSGSCVWAQDFTKNTCTQSIDCSINTDQGKCQNQSKACQWTGYDQGCRNNLNLCLINSSNYSCNTGAGCIQGTFQTCLPVQIDKWGCDKNSYDNCNTKDKPFCTQCIYNLQQQCPSIVNTETADQDCTGPCSLNNFTCQSTCNSLVSQQDCENQKDCQWSNNTCTNAIACPTSPKTVSECKSVQNCQVPQNTITCKAPVSKIGYQSYCLKLGDGCADTNYCSKLKVCVSDVEFCNYAGSCAKDPSSPAPYMQCLLSTSKTCSFPNNANCVSINNKNDCLNVSNNQCLWSDGKTCQNLKSNSDCQLLYRNSTSCNTLIEQGCQFQSGGVCFSKEADYLSSKLLTFFASNILCFVAYFAVFI
ncbi:hypothetical protein ABPG72_001438 [Tetrahymena utriculariae]